VVGIVSPAGATFVREELNIVSDAVRALGLVPDSPHLLDQYGYLGGFDKTALPISISFAEVTAILPIRGGWGCSRIFVSGLRTHPKIRKFLLVSAIFTSRQLMLALS